MRPMVESPVSVPLEQGDAAVKAACEEVMVPQQMMTLLNGIERDIEARKIEIESLWVDPASKDLLSVKEKIWYDHYSVIDSQPRWQDTQGSARDFDSSKR